MIRTERVRVFTRFNPEVPPNPNYYGCLYRTGRAFRISLDDEFGVIVRLVPAERALRGPVQFTPV
ncbi:MAG: hypothetical protein ACR2LY_05920 [Thermoleophilaceae bacterium]